MKRDFSRMSVVGYFVLLSGVVAVSHIPGVFLLAVFLFIVPGLVLLAANNLLIYSVAVLPIWLAVASKAPRRMLALAAAPIVLVALGPHVVGKAGYDAAVRPYVRGDFSQKRDEGRSFGSILIRGDNESRSGCGDLCQQLLLHGYVQTVVLSNEKGDTQFTVQTTADRCPAGQGHLLHSELSNAAELQGVCIVATDAARHVADVKIGRSEEHLFPDSECNESEGRFSLWCVIGYTRFDIHERVGADLKLVERRTRIHGGYAFAPFYIGVRKDSRAYFTPGVGLTFYNDLSIREILQSRYGWQPETLRPGYVQPTPKSSGASPGAPQVSIVEAILVRKYAPGEVLSYAESQALQKEWSRIREDSNRTPKDVETLKAIIRLPQLVDHFSAWIDPESMSSLSILIPDVLTRLEAPLKGKEAVRYSLGILLSVARTEDLRPYANRIVALMQDPERSRYLGLLARELDTLTPQAESVLLKILKRVALEDDESLSSLFADATVGLCRASRANDAAMAARFTALLDTNYVPSSNGADAAVLSGIAHTGGLVAARAAGERIYRYAERRNFVNALRQADPANWPDNCGTVN